MKTLWTILLIATVIFFGCSKSSNVPEETGENITIFFLNDIHGQIDNLSKVKHIIDTERKKTNVLVVSAGNMFSGNPVVDNYEEKGYPIIDLMNNIGFNATVFGNHEFDYGTETLKARINQSNFPWICANIITTASVVPQPPAFVTIDKGNLRITFLGLIETGGSDFTQIPSSHPWRVKDFSFSPVQDIVQNYRKLKQQENADLLIALSHLGYKSNDKHIGDFDLARQNVFFDMIIGGHSHAIIDTTFNNIPVFHAGAYLHYLGKIELLVKNQSIENVNYTLINLNSYPEYDANIKAVIEDYNNFPELKEVIGRSDVYHSKSETGCFYTDALRHYLNVDVSFQNNGGIRSVLNKGDITKRHIYEIAPFNNGTVVYNMTAEEIKNFLKGSGSGFYYSGIQIKKVAGEIEITDLENIKIPDEQILKVGVNDYIPAVHLIYFPEKGKVQPLTVAESIIAYLKESNQSINYSGCLRYFRY